MTDARDPTRRFLVAFSFAGEHRDYVRQVDEHLCKHLRADQVFYDKRYEAELARLNLDTYLQEIYRYQSALIVVCVSSDYAKKDWPGLEWRAIRDIIKQRDSADIMPFRFDDGDLQGFFSTDGYIDARSHTPEEAARLILQRVGVPPAPPPANTKTPQLTPSQHEAMAISYLDELVAELHSSKWCFRETFELEQRVSEHVTALGLETPFKRTDSTTPEEMVVWLTISDPLSGIASTRRIASFSFAPPPAKPGTVTRIAYERLDAGEQETFKRFVERLKREVARRAAVASAPVPAGSSLEQKISRLSLASLIGVCGDAIEKYAALRPELFRELLQIRELPGGPWRIQYKRDPAEGDYRVPPKVTHHTGTVTFEVKGHPFEGVGVIRQPETYAPFHSFAFLDPEDKRPEPETPAAMAELRVEFLLRQMLENMKVLAKSLEDVQRLAVSEKLEVDTTALTKLAVHLPVFPYWVRTKGMTKADYDKILADEKPHIQDALVALHRLRLAVLAGQH